MNFNMSWARLWAVILKEFTQMRRDRMTFGMMIGIPLIQLILFGYAINTDPKHLPSAIVTADMSRQTRNIVTQLQNSQYFHFINRAISDAEADKYLRRGDIQFAIYFPPRFTELLLRHQRPELLVEADATDPAATSNAIGAVKELNHIIATKFTGSLQYLKVQDDPVNLIIHAKYNPENITQYNIVPGLLGVVLTMTMVVITSLAMTRERERGTMESLLAMPVRPIEVVVGKITPYIVVGYIQVTVILVLAYFIFHVPIQGNVLLLLLACFPFVIANLSVGLAFSMIASNQLQAMQSSFFFFLPSIMLSGFMFPFHGMPIWAQAIGNLLPLTHFLVIVRGIMLKGNGVVDILPSLGAILLFFSVMMFIGVKRYRQTLD